MMLASALRLPPGPPYGTLRRLGAHRALGPTIGPMDGSLVAQSTFGGGAPARTG